MRLRLLNRVGTRTASTGWRLAIIVSCALVAAAASQGVTASPPTIDLSTTAADVIVAGSAAYDSSGFSVAAGDVNGDGIEDMIVGAWSASPGGRSIAGTVYVVYGHPSLASSIDLNGDADVAILGENAGDHLGTWVASGDFNGDDYDDVLIGAYAADPGGRNHAGAAYVILGGSILPPTIDLSAQSAALTILGDDADDALGLPVAAGDVTGDGIDDLLIGARDALPRDVNNRGAGKAYVIAGSSVLPALIDLSNSSADMTVIGDDAGDWLGSELAAGDVNADGVADVIVGAPLSDPAGRSTAGSVYVVHGGASLPAVIDLGITAADLRVIGGEAGDVLAIGVASGDVNGDGIADLVVGADSVAGERGETYVLNGGPSLSGTVDLSVTSAAVTVRGADAGDLSGTTIAVGDTNADGAVDILIGAPEADPGGRIGAGETYAISGAASLPGFIDLHFVNPDLTILGAGAGDYSGSSLAAGDVNGDGAKDVIMGAYHADPFSRTDAGAVYLVFGCIDTDNDSLCNTADPDDDNDGVPDDFEVGHPCLNSLVPDANADPDADGLTNIQEYGIGADPCDPDTDGDGLVDGVETDTSIYVSPSDTGTDPLDPDSDRDLAYPGVRGDGCGDGKELLLLPTTNPTDPWDFFSVPVPALFAPGDPTTRFRDSVVSSGDAQAVFAYFAMGAKTGTTEYEQDLNVNGIKDGWEYDRSFAGPGMSGAPNGVVTAADAQLAFAQFKFGYHC